MIIFSPLGKVRVNPSTIERRQDYPFVGLAKRALVRETSNSNANEWLSEATTSYAKRDLNNFASEFVFSTERVSNTAELDANGGQAYRYVKRTQSRDDDGNVDELRIETGSSVTDIQRIADTLNNYFPADYDSWLISRLESSTNTRTDPLDANNVETRSTDFTYVPGHLAVNTITREPLGDDSLRLKTTFGYDDYGNIEEQKEESFGSDAEIRINTIDYQGDYRLPSGVTNALNLTNSFGHSTTIIYDDVCDQPEEVIDANQQKIVFDYDNFCRQKKVTSNVNVSLETEYFNTPLELACAVSDCQSPPAFKIVTTPSFEAPASEYYNLYGQSLLAETQGMTLSDTIRQRNEYDNQGRVSQQSQPYFVGETEQWTNYTYDKVGRPKQTTLAYLDSVSNTNAKIAYEYGVASSSNTVEQFREVTNTLGNVTTAFSNALSQITKVSDADNQNLHYAYDLFGNLAKTTDAGVDDSNTPHLEGPNSIVLSYDLLGRRTSLDDPDLGLSTFTFDAFSQLRSQTDAKDQTIFTRYDKLSRLIERKVPMPNQNFALPSDQWSFERSIWTYDTALLGGVVGKPAHGLTHSISRETGSDATGYTADGYSNTFSYDDKARSAGASTTIKVPFSAQTETFEERFSYDAAGRIGSRHYPESGTNKPFMVRYEYQNGYLSKINSPADHTDSCTEQVTHWEALQYDALGRTKLESVGSLVETTRVYDPGQGVLKHIESIISHANSPIAGQTIQDIDYTYDANNNLQTRDDLLGTGMEVFGYDNLERLRSYTRSGGSTTVDYNAIGNITFKSDVGTYRYEDNGAGPHALTRVDAPAGGLPATEFDVNWDWDGQQVVKSLPSIHGQTFLYDANGNITVSGNRVLSWTTFDKPTSIRVQQPNSSYRGSELFYGPNFDRVAKSEAEFDALGVITNIAETTLYIGKEYERITDKNGAIKHRYTISTGGNNIQIERDHNSTQDKPKYFLGDNLGSTNVILDALGNVEQRLAFDPWGMRLNVGDPLAVNSITNKGFTGHEMDDETGLVNMNARIYDPYLGRFLSADPVLPDAHSMQSFNRYSYVENNPLKYVDPTGNFRLTVRVGVGDHTDRFVFGNYAAQYFLDVLDFRNDVREQIQERQDANNGVIVVVNDGLEGPRTAGSSSEGSGDGDLGDPLFDDPLRSEDSPCSFFGSVECRPDRFGRGTYVLSAGQGSGSTDNPFGGDGEVFLDWYDSYAYKLFSRFAIRVGEASPIVLLEGAELALNVATVKGLFRLRGIFGVGPESVRISRSRFPESARHIDDAINAGKPNTLTINRPGASANRRESLRGTRTRPGQDRDEFPPAMFQEGGKGASVRSISRSDNRGSGACIGAQCRGLANGTRVRIDVVD